LACSKIEQKKNFVRNLFREMKRNKIACNVETNEEANLQA